MWFSGDGGVYGYFFASDEDGTGKVWTRRSWGAKKYAGKDNRGSKEFPGEVYYMRRVIDGDGNLDETVLDYMVKMWGDSKVIAGAPN